MFADEDDELQYTGLVARGYFCYESEKPANPAQPIPKATTVVRAAELASALALERHNDSTSSCLPHTSSATHYESHELYSDNQEVDITPLLLKRMEKIILITSDASSAARINHYQVALACRRMKLISSTLRQIPHPAPSPRLLTALQSLCLLARQCAYDAAEKDEAATQHILYGPDEDPLGRSQCWPVLLCQHFTCRLLFHNAYRRLWTAWRMYSPLRLEEEDAAVEEKDCSANANVMLQLLFADQGSPELEARLPPATVEHYKRDMLGFYRRKEVSPWRMFYQQLEPMTQPVHGFSLQLPDCTQRSSSATPPEAEGMGIRFRVQPTVYSYHSVPVVVKALCAAPQKDSAAAALSFFDCDAVTEAAAIRHTTDFLQDVACRCMWCHPHVVSCLGAYTEKFVPAAKELAATEDRRVLGAQLQDEICGTAELQRHKAQEFAGLTPAAVAVDARMQTELSSRTPAASARPSVQESGLPWSNPVDALSGTPVMALGYVTELQTSANTGAPCITLGDMLFPSSSTAPAAHHYFSLFEALDICAQLADALQYILEDGGDVPAAVRTSWMTLDPFNVYVVRTIGTSTSANELEPQRQPQLSRDGMTTSVGEGGAPCVWRSGNTPSAKSPSMTGDAGDATFCVHDNSTPVPEPAERGNMSLLRGSLEPTTHVNPTQMPAPFAGATRGSSQHGPQHFVVRYCPPSDWTERTVGSRWRPHPCATAPASYAVVQMFLTLITRQVPYAAFKGDINVQRHVFDATAGLATGSLAGAETAASDVQARLSQGGYGYSLPSSLPPSILQWCCLALSLDKSQPPMELESLRDALAMIRASLPEKAGNCPLPQDALHSPIHSTLSWEMDSHY